MRSKLLKYLAFLLQCLPLLMLAGCNGTTDGSSEDARNQPVNPQEKGGWDDFPNKYRPMLLDLNANVPQLPAPFGTRYATLSSVDPGGLNKVSSSDPGCPGDSAVFKYQSRISDFFLYDTITYYDSTGMAHCASPGGSRASERHIRHIVEVGVGEAWETIHDSITDQDVLPRHTIHGTGLIQLESGRAFTIRSYDLTLLTQFGTQDAFVLDAGMELLYKDGFTIHLGLAKPHPYKAVDFFPVDGSMPHDLIMTGPISHASANGGVDTVGFVDLFDDHLLQVRDWTGARIAF
jgi:hypothetical protein